jgi:rRNA maturation RNase YbeY
VDAHQHSIRRGDLAIEIADATRARPDAEAVADLAEVVLRAEGVTLAEVGIAFIGERRMRGLNRELRGVDQVTDVLSFPLEEPGEWGGAWAAEDSGAPARGSITPTEDGGAAARGSITPAEDAIMPGAGRIILSGDGSGGDESGGDESGDESGAHGQDEDGLAADRASVSAAGSPPRLLGDVVICVRQAERQAAADGNPLAFELAVLLVHGLLHLLGWGHDERPGPMALRQAELLHDFDWSRLV